MAGQQKKKQFRQRRKPPPASTSPLAPATPVRPQFTIDRPEVNERLSLVVVPEYAPDDPRSQIPPAPQGHRGVYQVTLLLSVPGSKTFHGDLDVEQLLLTGDSLLQAPQGLGVAHLHVKLYNEVESSEARFSLNAEGRLATAVMRVAADGFVAAERWAHDLVLPLLSRWSFIHDVAIDVAGYEVVEEATQARKYRYGAIGKVRGLVADPNARIVSTPEHRQLLAAYREGLNASNVFFQVLSFFKVTEGVRHLRTGRARQARARGLDVERYAEAIPADFADVAHDRHNAEAIWKPYLGKRFGAVLKDFGHTKRDAMAHIDPQQAGLSADKFDDIEACLTILPVLRYVAREMLRNELAHAPEAPS